MENAINELQLETAAGYNYFDLNTEKCTADTISLIYCMNTISYGKNFSFSLDYEYSDEILKPKEYLADIRSCYSETYTLSVDKNVFEGIANKNVKYTAKAGTMLIPDKVWIGNGLLWLRVRNTDGDCGWVPMGAETTFLEIHYDYGSDVEEKIEIGKNIDMYFQNSLFPDANVLYRLGKMSDEDGEYENAIIYCELISSLDEEFLKSRDIISDAEIKFSEALLEEVDKTCNNQNYNDAYKILIMNKETLSENENYSKYVDICQENLVAEGVGGMEGGTEEKNDAEINLENARESLLLQMTDMNLNEQHPLSYCPIDLDKDGVEEIILRSYTPEGVGGGSYNYDIFQYSGESGKYKHLSYGSFNSYVADGIIYYWEDMGYIVVDFSMADANFVIYEFEDGQIQQNGSTSSDMSYLPTLNFSSLDMPVKEESEKYGNFMTDGKYLQDATRVGTVLYSICDLNNDGINELILKEKIDEATYQYWFYDNSIQLVGTFENWQNWGNGELYADGNAGEVAVDLRYPDGLNYIVYGITDKVEKQYSVIKTDASKLNDEGEYGDSIEYSSETPSGEVIDIVSTKDQWDTFENSLVEIAFYQMPWSIESMRQRLLQSEQEESDDGSEYILPDAASRNIEASELINLPEAQIQLAINEIFARHGRCFKTVEYDEYFRSKSWYRPNPNKTDDQIMAEFNEYEKANIAMLEGLREG